MKPRLDAIVSKSDALKNDSNSELYRTRLSDNSMFTIYNYRQFIYYINSIFTMYSYKQYV